MDPRSKVTFEAILEKPIDEITPEEARFLRARQSYLKKPQLEEYDSIINPPEPKKKEKEEKKEDKEKPPIYVAKKNQPSDNLEPVKDNEKEES